MDSTADTHLATLPAPLSPEELLTRSDLAGRARVISVVRVPEAGGYLATLRFEKFTKGGPKTKLHWLSWMPWTRTFIVKMRRAKRGSNGKPLPGEWFDGYRAGDTVMTHLTWNSELGYYTTVWWNAVWQTPHGPHR